MPRTLTGLAVLFTLLPAALQAQTLSEHLFVCCHDLTNDTPYSQLPYTKVAQQPELQNTMVAWQTELQNMTVAQQTELLNMMVALKTALPGRHVHNAVASRRSSQR